MMNYLRRYFGLKPRPPDRSQPVGWSSISWFLGDLEAIGDEHDEIYDTDVREQLWSYLEARFITHNKETPLPKTFGMFTEDANEKIRKVFADNASRMDTIIEVFELDTAEKRKISFTNTKLTTERGSKLEDFFGFP